MPEPLLTVADLRVAFERSAAAGGPDATLWLAASLGWYRYTRRGPSLVHFDKT